MRLQLKLLNNRNSRHQVSTHSCATLCCCSLCSLQMLPLCDSMCLTLQVQNNELLSWKEGQDQEEAHNLHLLLAHEHCRVSLLPQMS